MPESPLPISIRDASGGRPFAGRAGHSRPQPELTITAKARLRKQVLFDNHLEVARGEIVILTGPSGSGKTTLLTLIGALRTVQEGSLEVLGNQLRGAAMPDLVRVRRQLGFIFQAHNLFESLTAFQNVRMAAELFD